MATGLYQLSLRCLLELMLLKTAMLYRNPRHSQVATYQLWCQMQASMEAIKERYGVDRSKVQGLKGWKASSVSADKTTSMLLHAYRRAWRPSRSAMAQSARRWRG